MKIPRSALPVLFLGLVVACEPDPAGPVADAVQPEPAFFAPMAGPMDSNAAVIHKGEIGCRIPDGEGYFFPASGWDLPCTLEVATNSQNLNAILIVRASGVPNPTGKLVQWGPFNPGPDWIASYEGLLTGPPYPCFLLGADYDLDNPLYTVNWSASVTPSGEGKLICKYQKKWEFQWPS